MKIISVREARQALSKLDEILEKEGELKITRHGVQIARVLPVGRPKQVPSHKKLRVGMSRMRKPSQDLIREERDAR